jgi:hypothetical protein
MTATVAPSAVSFWHPVGPHGRESLESIVQRKRADTATHGFTYWSFAAARPERVFAWRKELAARGIRTCAAVCCGDTPVDPTTESTQVTWAKEYSEDLVSWRPMPHRMTSFHNPRGAGIASAFVVNEVAAPEARVARPTRWFRAANHAWEESRVPTRGQYLVEHPAESTKGQRVRLVLTLGDPFVVWVR